MNLARSRVTHTQELGVLAMFFEATPEHVEGCGIIASTANSRPFIVGLWWICEDNEGKTFKIKEAVRGMGRGSES